MENVTVDVTSVETSAMNVSLVIMDFLIVPVSLLKLLKLDRLAISNYLSFTEKSSFRLAGCQCSRIGTAKCDVFGRCLCHSGYNGTMCDQCQNGFSKNDSGSCKGTVLFFFIILRDE